MNEPLTGVQMVVVTFIGISFLISFIYSSEIKEIIKRIKND